MASSGPRMAFNALTTLPHDIQGNGGPKVFYDVLCQTACISTHMKSILFWVCVFVFCGLLLEMCVLFFFLFGGVGAARRLGQCFAKLPFCRFRSSCLVKITGSGGNPYLTTAHPHSFHQVSDGRKTFWIGIGCASGRARIIVSSGLGRWKLFPSFWIIFAEPGPQLCTVQTAWAQYHKAFIPTTLGFFRSVQVPCNGNKHTVKTTLLFFLPAISACKFGLLWTTIKHSSYTEYFAKPSYTLLSRYFQISFRVFAQSSSEITFWKTTKPYLVAHPNLKKSLVKFNHFPQVKD